jgi:hypothetical protein
MALSAISNLRGTLGRSLPPAPPATNPFAKVLAAAGGSQQPTGTAAVQQQYDQSLSDLQKTLATLFSTAGVDPSHEIALQQGSDGKLTLANDHPDQTEIEQVLAAHPELAAKFAALAGQLRQIKQAQADQSQPIDYSKAQFTLTLAGGQASGSLS